VSFVTAFGDVCLWPAYVLGLRMSGWAEPSSVLPVKVTVPSCDENTYITPTGENNRRVIESMGSSGDVNLDRASWEKSLKEFEVKTLLGPFSLSEIPDNVRLLPRRPIWETHGGKIEPSVRNIDDGLFGEQNDTVGLTSVHRPCSVDKLVSRGRQVSLRYPALQLSGFTSDFGGAYRQVPSDPHQSHLFGVTMWDPVQNSVGSWPGSCSDFR